MVDRSSPTPVLGGTQEGTDLNHLSTCGSTDSVPRPEAVVHYVRTRRRTLSFDGSQRGKPSEW